MRIVFMGTPDFAVPSLRALCEAGHQVVGVFTQPDRPRGRGKKLQPSPVKAEAVARGIPVFQPTSIRKQGVEDFRALQPELCVTAAFGQILSKELLDIPPRGCVNVHASLLPKHRGSAPIAWGILQGDELAGITTMMMAPGIDDGDMLLQRATPIGSTETCGELTERLSHIGAELLIETLRRMETGELQRLPQDEAAMTYDPKLTKELAVIDWSADAFSVARRIHALNPWPCCTIQLKEDRLKLLKAEVVAQSGSPGRVLRADAKEGLILACGQNAIRVLLLQNAGGKAMNSRDYLRGHAIEPDQAIQSPL